MTHHRGRTRHTTLGKTPLDGFSATRSDLYLTTQDNHNWHTFMPPVGFEPTIAAGKRPQTYVLDRADNGTGSSIYCWAKNRGVMLPSHNTPWLHSAEWSDEECGLSLLFIDWCSFPGVKRARSEADRLTSSSSEVKNQWRYTWASLLCFIAWKWSNQTTFFTTYRLRSLV